jgi:hypothetical protein
MSIYSNACHHLSRMETAIAVARRHLVNSSGLEGDHAIMKALTKSVIGEIAGLTETLTDEKVWGIEACDEGILDEIGVCFRDAADKDEDRRENPSEPSRDFAVA